MLAYISTILKECSEMQHMGLSRLFTALAYLGFILFYVALAFQELYTLLYCVLTS